MEGNGKCKSHFQANIESPKANQTKRIYYSKAHKDRVQCYVGGDIINFKRIATHSFLHSRCPDVLQMIGNKAEQNGWVFSHEDRL